MIELIPDSFTLDDIANMEELEALTNFLQTNGTGHFKDPKQLT